MNINADFVCWQFVGGDRDREVHIKRVHSGDWRADCKCPRTVECMWQGDERGAAVVDAPAVLKYTKTKRGQSPVGKVFSMGGVRLRVVDLYVTPSGAYCDAFVVMLAHNPHSELQTLYRRAARWLLRKAVTTEARVRGFMLQPVEGRVMPFADRLARKLL